MFRRIIRTRISVKWLSIDHDTQALLIDVIVMLDHCIAAVIVILDHFIAAARQWNISLPPSLGHHFDLCRL